MFASFTFKRVLAGLAVIAIVLISGCKPKGNVMTDNKFNFDPETNQAVQVHPAVTKELYSRWRSPRLGKANPERMNNPVWEWLVKTRINAFQANDVLSGPSPFQSGPGWCFDRMGQSSNSLPDGRVIFIAGEHEDSYDPDFYIYNDVVIQHPDGRIDLFGYPREIFPPTDFHSATVMGDQIIIIGNLGYPNDRHPDKTQVLSLNLKSFEISTVNTSGEMPVNPAGHFARSVDCGDFK